MKVDANRPIGPWRPIWNWFGYDEPNYTTTPEGRALLADLAALHHGPVHIRVHNLLTSGDGTPALKWGSTGVYSEDAVGQPAYSWTILDSIFDAFVETGITPFVQAGFMPEALTTGLPPYRHDFPRTGITTGWAWPPRDYRLWGALIEAWAGHMVDRYGMARVRDWPWEIWNEPDGLYWRGSVDDFCRLHDVADAAIRRAIPEARVGGPHVCGPTSPEAAAFLRAFLRHCSEGRNHATGGMGTRLDFVAFHAKGKPEMIDSHVRMGLSRQLAAIEAGLSIVEEFAELNGIPVILGESDPEGCAACPAATHPANAYREGPLYGASVVEAMMRTLQLAGRAGIEIEGAVTWAFTFPGEPFFAGYRELATNGIAKPVLNAFRMLGRLGDERVATTSTGARRLDTILADGAVPAPNVDLVATRSANRLAILVWNYHDDDLPYEGGVTVELTVSGLAAVRHVCRHHRIDRRHSNAHDLWQRMGSPQPPSAEGYRALKAADGLELLVPEAEVVADEGQIKLGFELPRHGLSLIEVEPR
ncbi:MAG TPA: beta-xylosidase [Bauldia sp.]|nr:beta-xylosidase [Bauldia sp.]